MMVADLTDRETPFPSDSPEAVFGEVLHGVSRQSATTSRLDGQRLLMCKSLNPSEQRVGEIHLTLNWFEELNRLAPPD